MSFLKGLGLSRPNKLAGMTYAAVLTAGWCNPSAALDMDLVNNKFRFDNIEYKTRAEFLTAIEGSEAGGVITIGPTINAGAPELVLNGTFDTNLNNWTSGLNGASTAAIVAAAARIVSDATVGANGVGTGGAINQQVNLTPNQLFVFNGISTGGTTQLRLSVAAFGGNYAQISMTANQQIKQSITPYASPNHLSMSRTAAGTVNLDNISVKAGNMFKNFQQGGHTFVIKGKTGVMAAANQHILTLHNNFDRDLITVYWNTGNQLRVQYKWNNVVQAEHVLGTVANNTEFTVRVGAKLNEFFAKLNNGAVFVDSLGTMPVLGRILLGNSISGAGLWTGEMHRLTIENGGGIAQFMQGSRYLHTDGDSFMGGAFSVVLPTTLQTLSGVPVFNTGVGGSTLAEVRDRLIAAPADIKAATTIIWDGSENGFTTVNEYLNIMQQAIDALGHTRFILLPPCSTYQGAAGVAQDIAIRDEMQVRWPGHILDWRTFLALEVDGTPTIAMFASAPGDSTHLSQAAMDLAAAAILNMLNANSW